MWISHFNTKGKYMKKLLIALLFSFVSTSAFAGGHSPCGVTNGTINVLANEFTTLRIVMEEAEKCAGSDADFSVTHSVDHQKLQGPALEAVSYTHLTLPTKA